MQTALDADLLVDFLLLLRLLDARNMQFAQKMAADLARIFVRPAVCAALIGEAQVVGWAPRALVRLMPDAEDADAVAHGFFLLNPNPMARSKGP
jgi:hypothetical protein